MVLFVPRPWYQRCCRHNWHGTLWHALLSWPCKMSLLLLKKPHGGPITHSSTGSKPDCPVHPLFPKLFLARGLVWNSWATFLMLYSGITRHTYSRYSEPLSHSGSDFEQLFIRLESLIVPSYLTLEVFYMFNSRDNLMLIHGLTPRLYPSQAFCRSQAAPYLFVSTLEILKQRKQRTTSPWWPEAEKWRCQCNGSTSSRRATKTEKIR